MKNRKRKYRCVKRPEIEDKEQSNDSSESTSSTVMLGRCYPRGVIVRQQWYQLSDSPKNIDIKFIAHDAFLGKPSTVPLLIIIERLKSQII